MRWLLAFVAVTAAAILGVVGRASGADSVTHEQWVRTADAACNNQAKAIAALPKPDGTIERLIEVLPRLTMLSTQLMNQLHALTPPAHDRSQVHRLFGYWRIEIREDREAYSRLKSGDTRRGMVALGVALTQDKNEDAQLRQLGTSCRRA
jgi:hypothetical protein